MKQSLRMIAIVLVALLLGSCATMMNTSYGSSDLYRTDNRVVVAQELTAIAEAEKARAEARKAQYEALMAEAQYEAMTSNTNFNSILASDYESAYARRLYGFSSPTYRLPSSYYDLATSEAMFYATAYDPAFYNVMVSGGQVWVEPKYITSMFGSWGATNVTFGIYASPWTYGWSYYVNPFYYSWWGYPRYSWYDWNWTLCYHPFYFGWGPAGFHMGYHPGFYPGYPPHHPHHPHNPPMPPSHRPSRDDNNHRHNLNGSGHNTGSRYTSPTSNRNYGVSEVRGGNRNTGAVSSGVNERRGSSGTAVNNTQVRTTRNSNSGSSSNVQRSNNFRSSSTSRSSQSNNSFRSGSSSSNTSNRSGSVSSGSRSGGSISSRR